MRRRRRFQWKAQTNDGPYLVIVTEQSWGRIRKLVYFDNDLQIAFAITMKWHVAVQIYLLLSSTSNTA